MKVTRISLQDFRAGKFSKFSKRKRSGKTGPVTKGERTRPKKEGPQDPREKNY